MVIVTFQQTKKEDPESHFKKKNTDELNVASYGAAGDGKTDDTKAIQKALNSGSGKKVIFPKGEYRITESLRVKDNTELYGKGAAIDAGNDLESVVNVKGSDIDINGLLIDGKNTALKGISILEGSNYVSISDSKVQNFTQPAKKPLANMTVSGIRIEGGVRNVKIDKSRIQNVKARNPVKGWGHFVARGILISPESKDQPESENISVTNSSFKKIGPKDDGDGIVVQGFKNKMNLQILNNSFAYTYKRAIKIQSPGVLIKGNKIYNNFLENNFYATYKEKNNYDMWAAISIYANNVTVEKNTISGEGNYQRVIDVANASHIKILNNFIKNGEKGNYQQSDIVAITNSKKDHIQDFTVSNNVFVNGRYGVYAKTSIPELIVKNNKQVNVQDYQYPYPKEVAGE
nr:glycosyl hydrolase family 28-related protein [Metabacillus kandeliae]